ncbi:hypothetical protein HID58_032450 [Brassica napus]|uniref:BnaA09g08520D protein n=3 Tax=Brassica TaxID=3705 RepID=A0A078HHL9_BRANA|nr:uncharacterized protein LOC106449999 [Brassica napus]CAG7860655.1 unnamed protein product [Brassica rapa]KAH0909129.1 hypothetical protein HID58_032450 [Brassica napus]CAF2038106.1 unnamed protein product [Brassica napus]CDY37231.1 BnaA09g08520D [Brassica napus]VDC59111.1 unnamed protein product [Brassica rapa]
MSRHNAPQPPRDLTKQHSWPHDVNRNEAWLRKKKKRSVDLIPRSKSVTNDDVEELRGCIELGFGFEPDSPDLNQRLTDTIPALDLYCAVHRQYCNHLSRTSSFASETDSISSSTTTVLDKGDDRKTVKQKLKQWARVVAFSVRQARKPS